MESDLGSYLSAVRAVPMIAMISDIHANLSALQAVLRDIESIGGVNAIYCLGDVVGYGPQPAESLDLAARASKLILLGNHEHALIYGAYGFTAVARKAIEWTRETLENAPRSQGRQLMDLIQNLPTSYTFDDVMLVHGSPRDHVMEYVLESDIWEGAEPGKMEAIFAAMPRLCFCGHTHRPGVFTDDQCFLPADELVDGFDVSDSRYLINVGSVGQPRDKDPRACYLVYTGTAVHYRRVEYDIGTTAALIRENHRLSERLASRLFKGE